jgi:hypothetical protein
MKYMYKYVQNKFPKAGLLEEPKGGGKEWQRVNNIEINHICVGTRHNKTH